MAARSLALGLDIGSSSIKASVLDLETGVLVASASSPSDKELPIEAPQAGFAEQSPDMWWEHVQRAVKALGGKGCCLTDIAAVGISYQMHGLVVVDKDLRPLRPAIIWCDSRAVPFGAKAFESLGQEFCLKHYFNSPGNFTAAKLAWVKEREPELFDKIAHFMLPGDYISVKLTGEATTTALGLSEGILWDFQAEKPAEKLLQYYGFPSSLIPKVVPTLAVQGQVSSSAAQLLGLRPGIPVSYRAGDQQNNALSLNVLEPGELAATAGTSGVVVGIGEQRRYDTLSRVNTFLHVNHTAQASRYCTLLCVNGTGILNSWLRRLLGSFGTLPAYTSFNELAAGAEVGSAGLSILPYGNGAERSLGNKVLGASVHGLDLNRHKVGHLLRASQEGIVFALQHGLEIMNGMGITPKVIRAGHANMFLSPVFREAFAAVSGASIELIDTDGSQGAARGAAIGAGFFGSAREAFRGLKVLSTEAPAAKLVDAYAEAYKRWKSLLQRQLSAE